MKQFFKFMFASMLGFFLAFLVAGFIGFLVLLGFAMSLKNTGKKTVKDNTVLEIRLDDAVVERGREDPFRFHMGSFSAEQPLGLNDILSSLRKAADDDHIRGILLHLSSVEAGIGTIQEIRNALAEFRRSGKFIYAYAEDYTQGAYYLASVADSIFLHPQGDLAFHGLHAQYAFFKGTLEKLEVEPEIIRHGKFKSAVEPFMLDKMSAENREQTRTLIDAIWQTYLGNISSSRKIPVPVLDSLADGMLIQMPEDARKAHLVDRIAYYDEVISSVKKAAGQKDSDKERLLALKKYIGDDGEEKGGPSKKKIAVIYATGEIRGGDGGDEYIGSDGLAKAIRKARLDSTVKAIVLRVNSPGGSALASDVIWRETILARKAKPFVVSMGDVAASGGYYISCAADTIVAQPNTITGSIGVFGLLFNTQNMFSHKLGITFDTVRTNRYADLGNMTRPMTDDERAIIQRMVERIYDTFTGIVADGRKLDKAFVDSIGQGRVWSGVDAKRLGLVDVLGGMDTAMALAAKMAGIDEYKIISLPEQKPVLQKLLDDLSGDASQAALKKELGENYVYYERLRSLAGLRGIQARMLAEPRIY